MSEQDLERDIARVRQIPIVDKMLEIICRTTEMGFAAVARVTEDRWIACSVRDEIQFGLKPRGELPIKTTICDEIRASGKEVVIDHVSGDPHFCQHHTPAMYGFQSYISVPIIKKNGEFFGTLCAIDPRPRIVNNVKTVGMFTLFAELLAFHLESLELLDNQMEILRSTTESLTAAEKENEQYAHLTHHVLMEPARKIALYCDILANETIDNDPVKAKSAALQLKFLSIQLIERIRPLKEF